MLVDFVQQHAQTEDVGQQDKFLTSGTADLADTLEEIHCGGPFLTGQPYFAGEIMQVLH